AAQAYLLADHPGRFRRRSRQHGEALGTDGLSAVGVTEAFRECLADLVPALLRNPREEREMGPEAAEDVGGAVAPQHQVGALQVGVAPEADPAQGVVRRRGAAL